MDASSLLVAAAASGAARSPLADLLPFLIPILIFYFILFRPMQSKQKRLEQTVAALKPKDRVIVNPGIFATVVTIDGDTLVVKVDENTKLRILKSAVAGLQEEAAETEKK